MQIKVVYRRRRLKGVTVGHVLSPRGYDEGYYFVKLTSAALEVELLYCIIPIIIYNI